MKKVLLAGEIVLPTIGGPSMGPFGEWWSRWGTGRAGAVEALKSFTAIISNVIGFFTIVAGIWFMFQFMVAGISWISAGGNKEAVSGAQDRMRNALIGMVIVVAAWAIVGVIGNLLGLDILIRNPGDLIDLLTP